MQRLLASLPTPSNQAFIAYHWIRLHPRDPMSAKLSYRVIVVTSHDTDHEAKELEIRNRMETDKLKNKGKGWSSARFCAYPQEVVLALERVSEISQIQILSHQSKISSKVEIWIGLDLDSPCQAHSDSTYKSINWKRLGYLSLDENERSNWKARELKSVYINGTANYVRFTLHESHINAINLFNQVGIVAITILGKVAADHPLDAKPLSVEHPPPAAVEGASAGRGRGKGKGAAAPRPHGLDEATLQKIEELTALKKAAVEKEDYLEAKRCKSCIEGLQSAAQELSRLEAQKKVAVEQEDYDTAITLKQQILRLRAISLNPDHPSPAPAPAHHPAPGPYAPNANGSHFANGPTAHNVHRPIYGQHGQHGQQHVAGGYPQGPPPQSQYVSAPPQQSGYPEVARSNLPNHSNPNLIAQHPVHPQHQAMGGGVAHSVSHSVSQSQTLSPQHLQRPEDRQIRPMKRQYGTVNAQNVNPFGTATAADTDEHGHRQSQSNAVPQNMANGVSAVNTVNTVNAVNAANNVAVHAVNGVNGVNGGNGPEALEAEPAEKEGPPPLKASVRKGAERAIEVFGEWTVRLLHSPDWTQRDEGLQSVRSFLSNREHPDDRQVVRVAAKLILKAVQDRVAGVILSGIETLNVLVTVYGGDGEVGGHEMARSLHSVIQSLVNLLGHSNGRLVDGAGSIVIAMSHRHESLYRAVYGVLVKAMKKPLPRHLKGRGLILLQLVPQLKLPRGSDLSVAMDNLIRLQLTHKTGDVRDVGIQLTAMLYQMAEIRQRLVSYLERADLNDFIKETLNNALFDATGHRAVLERDPKSQKEQSRPSKAMFNTKKPAASSSTNRARGSKHKKGANRGNAEKRKQSKSNGDDQKQRGHGAQHNGHNGHHPAAASAATGGRHEQEEEEMEAEDVCNFCGLRDPQFVENEENLDLHYWQSCPMLTSCKLCEQVIEIATLHEHMITECESGIKHLQCTKCQVPVPVEQMRAHQGSSQCQRSGGKRGGEKCPLCLAPIGVGPTPWKQHLLTFPGCPQNPRPLSH